MRTVIHLPSEADSEVDAALSNAENLLNDDTIELEAITLVVNSAGVRRLTRNTRYADRIRELLDAGIDIVACQRSLDEASMNDARLIDGIETASSGVGILTRLQDDGYSYLRP